MNPLLFYMNVSDYDDILSELHKISCDKFIVHYTPYPHPHNLVRDFFLSHPEYTHLIVMAHDVLVKKEHYQMICETSSETGFDIVAAVCNVEQEGHPHHFMMNICLDLPSMDKTKRYYKWIPFGAVKDGIIKVKHQGNALTIISRKIIEKIDMEGDYVFKGADNRDYRNFTAAPDLTMSHVCDKMNIDIYADTRIKIKHYANHKPSKIGKVEGKCEFIKWVK